VRVRACARVCVTVCVCVQNADASPAHVIADLRREVEALKRQLEEARSPRAPAKSSTPASALSAMGSAQPATRSGSARGSAAESLAAAVASAFRRISQRGHGVHHADRHAGELDPSWASGSFSSPQRPSSAAVEVEDATSALSGAAPSGNRGSRPSFPGGGFSRRPSVAARIGGAGPEPSGVPPPPLPRRSTLRGRRGSSFFGFGNGGGGGGGYSVVEEELALALWQKGELETALALRGKECVGLQLMLTFRAKELAAAEASLEVTLFF